MLSKSSWVDHIGVVGDELACAIGAWKPPRSASSIASTTNGASRADRNTERRNVDAYSRHAHIAFLLERRGQLT